MNTPSFRLAMLGPIGWRTPPRHYGPWEQVVSTLTEGLVKLGVDVTLFASQDSATSAKLHAVAPRGYEEDRSLDSQVWKALHISELFEHATEFDLIHNNLDFLPLTYSRLIPTPVVTTIHGFSSESIVPVYEKYDRNTYYVSISNANRHPRLHYVSTVYHGIDLAQFSFHEQPGDYLLLFGRLDNDKGVAEAIEVAHRSHHQLIIAGPVSNQKYFKKRVKPHIDDKTVRYIGNVGPTERSNVLGKAKALLHMINFDEPFGLSVAEAMACGTPVIAMNRGSMPELVANKKTGFLVTSPDEAVAAVDQLDTIKRQDCRKRIEENFTVDQMVQGYLDVYQHVLQLSYERQEQFGKG